MDEIKALREMADFLRSNIWHAECQENVNAAIVYLDCARQNLIDFSNLLPRHHVDSVHELQNYPASCGSTIWSKATTSWEETTCPECLKHRPLGEIYHHVNCDHEDIAYSVTCGKPWNPKDVFTKDWSKVTCPECLKYKPHILKSRAPSLPSPFQHTKDKTP